MDAIYSALIPQATDTDRDAIAKILADLPVGVVQTLAKANCRIQPLRKGERYDDASAELKRLGVDVDAWPAPPAGLFVVSERTVYLRSKSRMTVCHETMHALDCALGDGVYLSSTSPEIRRMFSDARAFITPYAATGSDEYFAEAARGFCDRFNDEASFWPKATRARLRRIDPAMFEFLESLFGSLAPAGEQLALGLIA